MRITIATHADHGSRTGNRATANRWQSILKSLGHSVRIDDDFDSSTELLIALHARHTAPQIARFSKSFPSRPVVVALSGTDIYGQPVLPAATRKSLESADRLIVLQERAIDQVPRAMHEKTRIIHQSASRPARQPKPLVSCFEVSVCCHLRKEKDPLRAAIAARLLPSTSRIRINQVGRALSKSQESKVVRESRLNSRFNWTGPKPPWRARWLVARSKLTINSSIMEGGANVVSEALVAGVPILASKVSGNVGMLGAGYPGYFPVGDETALSQLMIRAETDSSFYQRLKSACKTRSSLFTLSKEQAAWKKLLRELN